MLRLVIEITGDALNMSPMAVVEKYVLSSGLKREDGVPLGLPMTYNSEEKTFGKSIITVRIVEAGQR